MSRTMVAIAAVLALAAATGAPNPDLVHTTTPNSNLDPIVPEATIEIVSPNTSDQEAPVAEDAKTSAATLEDWLLQPVDVRCRGDDESDESSATWRILEALRSMEMFVLPPVIDVHDHPVHTSSRVDFGPNEWNCDDDADDRRDTQATLEASGHAMIEDSRHAEEMEPSENHAGNEPADSKRFRLPLHRYLSSLMHRLSRKGSTRATSDDSSVSAETSPRRTADETNRSGFPEPTPPKQSLRSWIEKKMPTKKLFKAELPSVSCKTEIGEFVNPEPMRKFKSRKPVCKHAKKLHQKP